ncbi:ABC transporter permease [Litorilinea aerophila]|nr:ABC transporter permease [Litorilinea aerophila]MCC9076912.1 ABC transporter permease [Litorilinea aerophila]GIV78488.1 MAG: ABC transporter permease [Litorilinea sp.]
MNIPVWRRLGRAILIPVLALLTALAIGALVMAIFGDDPVRAYQGLFSGAFGNGRAWSTTIRKMTPLILTGLSVAVAFKAGLFNIGASGQFIIGTICSVAVGIHFEGLPAFVHLPLAIAAGIAGGTLWGALPGLLKVYTGAHEVIVTIMLNYVASLFAGWTVYAGGTQGQQPGPLWDPTAGAISETPDVLASAQIPWIVGPPYRVHWGVVLALLVAVVMWWLIYRTTVGFELRTVGQNARAARYAGMRVNGMIILAMALAGALAGLAGTIETLGLNHKFAPEFSGAVGFDGITVALLGQTHPLGVVLSAFMLGALDAGAARMQFESGVAADIIQVIQALVLAFVAAPTLIRTLYRVRRAPDEVETTTLTTGWAGR